MYPRRTQPRRLKNSEIEVPLPPNCKPTLISLLFNLLIGEDENYAVLPSKPSVLPCSTSYVAATLPHHDL